MQNILLPLNLSIAFGTAGAVLTLFVYLARRRVGFSRLYRYLSAILLTAIVALVLIGVAQGTRIAAALPKAAWIMAALLPTFGFFFLFYIDLPRNNNRQRILRKDFRLLTSGGVVLGSGLFLMLEWLGQSAWSHHGVLLALLPGSIFAFMVCVNPFMNMRNILAQTGVYFGLVILAALLFVAALSVGAPAISSAALAFIFNVTLLLFGGASTCIAFRHFFFLKMKPEYVLFPDVFWKEQELGRFLHDLQALDDTRASLNDLLETVLQNLFRVFHFDQAVIIASDSMRREHVRHFGPPNPQLIFESTRRYLPFMGLRLPGDFLAALDGVFLLEDAYPRPFFAHGSGSRYPRSVERIMGSLRLFHEAGFEVFCPLVSHGRVHGLIFLGGKRNGLPYFNGELKLIENVRPAFANAFRNRNLVAEVMSGGEGVGSVARGRMPISRRIQFKRDNRFLIATSPAMNSLLEKIERIAVSNLPVLIQGETGTGKELVARYLHQVGPGDESPFVAVNCAAIPETLWESEIFGHRRGAFTGADRDKPGLVEQASGGVLFFDEIGEMPLAMQPKILRLIQEKKYHRLGGRGETDMNCRLVFATHRDLQEMANAGEFRTDLYYRLNVHLLEIPPLRQRREDVGELIDFYVEHIRTALGRPGLDFQPSARKTLEQYSWPGNIRELENTIGSLFAEAKDDRIKKSELPAALQKRGNKAPARKSGATGNDTDTELAPPISKDKSFDGLMNDYSREVIAYALRACEGNRSRTATMLKMKRGRLLFQMKELGLR